MKNFVRRWWKSNECMTTFFLFWKSKSACWVCLIILNIAMTLFGELCDGWNSLRMLGDSPSAITIRQCLVYANEKVIKFLGNFFSMKIFSWKSAIVFCENLIFECCTFEHWKFIQFPTTILNLAVFEKNVIFLKSGTYVFWLSKK